MSVIDVRKTPVESVEGAATEQHWRVVRRELITGAIANAVIALIIGWLLFGGQVQVPVLGTDGGAFGILPGTFLFTLALTIGLTLSVRSRVRKGMVPRRLTDRDSSVEASLPGNVVLRGLMLALIAELALVPVTFALLAWLAPHDWSLAAVLTFNVGYFVLLSSLVVPVVVWCALRDDQSTGESMR